VPSIFEPTVISNAPIVLKIEDGVINNFQPPLFVTIDVVNIAIDTMCQFSPSSPSATIIVIINNYHRTLPLLYHHHCHQLLPPCPKKSPTSFCLDWGSFQFKNIQNPLHSIDLWWCNRERRKSNCGRQNEDDSVLLIARTQLYSTLVWWKQQWKIKLKKKKLNFLLLLFGSFRKERMGDQARYFRMGDQARYFL